MRKTIIIGGHLDSAYEMLMTNNEKYFLPVTLMGIGFAILNIILMLVKIVLLAAAPSGVTLALSPDGIWAFTWVDIGTAIVLALLGPCFVLVVRGYAFGKPTLGANDNLAGVGVACAVGKYFAQHRLSHVDLLVGGFGSEEIGDRGSDAYAKLHGQAGELDNAIAVVPESCGAGKELLIIDREKMHGVVHDAGTCQLLMEAYARYKATTENPVPCGIRTLGFAGTDAGSFSLAGYKASAIVGAAGAMNKPANWHSHHDTPQNLNLEYLGATADILRHFIEIIEEREAPQGQK